VGAELLKIIEQAVAGNTMIAFLAVFAAGILFGLGPCSLTAIPLVIGFVGGYAGGDRRKAFLYSLFFALGLALTLAALGVTAVLMGKLFGKVGPGWYIFLAILALAMGLNLLGVYEINFAPGNIKGSYRGIVGAFLLGLLFGVVLAPCATPVLVILLALVAMKGQALYGALLLLTFGVGKSIIVVVAGTFTGIVDGLAQSKGAASLSRLLRMGSGVLIILVGLYVLYQFI
jgi:cytochrome c biogenesis protein CcdA